MWRLWSNGVQCAQDSEMNSLGLALDGDHNSALFFIQLQHNLLSQYLFSQMRM